MGPAQLEYDVILENYLYYADKLIDYLVVNTYLNTIYCL
jgi:hypothetical protein